MPSICKDVSCILTSVTSSMLRHPPTRCPPFAQSPLSLQAGFCHKPLEVGLIPPQVMLHLGGLIATARGLFVPSSARTEMIVHAAQSPLTRDRASGILSYPGSSLHILAPSLANHPDRSFNMRVDFLSKLIPLMSPVIQSTLEC